MLIFTAKIVWKFLIQIQLTKSNPKITRGVKVPCLIPIRVNQVRRKHIEDIWDLSQQTLSDNYQNSFSFQIFLNLFQIWVLVPTNFKTIPPGLINHMIIALINNFMTSKKIIHNVNYLWTWHQQISFMKAWCSVSINGLLLLENHFSTKRILQKTEMVWHFVARYDFIH